MVVMGEEGWREERVELQQSRERDTRQQYISTPANRLSAAKSHQ